MNKLLLLALAGCSISASLVQAECQPSRWGAADEIGNANLITPASVLAASRLITTGKTYSAEQVQTMGMVGTVCEDDDFSESVETYIKEIAACSPLIIRLNKRAVKAHLNSDFQTALSGVSDLFLNTLMKTEDTLEGIASFYEKRKPEWKNR